MTEEARAYFERVAGDWDHLRRDYFSDAVREALIRRLAPEPNWVVADVGCGTGFLATGLLDTVATVHCLDASAPMLEQARRNLANSDSVHFHLADGGCLPLATGSVDAAVANMYLHHAPDPAGALREMARILRPGGRLVLSDTDEHQEEWMRAEMADLWLGFPRAAVRDWLAEAGLTEVAVEDCGQW